MNMNPLLRKMFAEFLGVAFFLTAILGSVSSGSSLFVPALATTLGLAILVTASISGGHLNPAVSLYFYSRQQLSLTDLFGYIAAQLAGAVFGTWVGLTLWNKSLDLSGASTHTEAPFLLGGLRVTRDLIWLVC